jgi:hypothetical protein
MVHAILYINQVCRCTVECASYQVTSPEIDLDASKMEIYTYQVHQGRGPPPVAGGGQKVAREKVPAGAVLGREGVEVLNVGEWQG